MGRRIYVASSWRNEHQPAVVETLRGWGHDVFDFRRPLTGGPQGDLAAGVPPLPDGFHWSEIDPEWEAWTPQEYREALDHPLAQAGFASDARGLDWCDTCLLVQPCGTSAHLELGWAIGAGRDSAIYFPDGARVEPELMPKFADEILLGRDELLRSFGP